MTVFQKHNGMRKARPMYQWIILLLIAILTLTACSSDEPEAAEEEERELEAYVEEEEEETINPYDYLSPYTLMNEALSVEVYLPGDEEIEEGLDDVEASLSGITVHLMIEESDITIEEIAEQEAEEIKEQGGREDVEYETDDNIGYIQYIINHNDEELYPCARIIKQDVLTEDYLLYTIIDINNMLADEDSEAVLEEVGDAYGITFG